MGNLGGTITREQLPQASNNFDALPAGWYHAAIQGAELKDTKSGGQMIAVKYQIVGPTHEGRIIFSNLNIRNMNEKAEEIGLRQLNEIMGAIALASIDDSSQLIGGQLMIKLLKTEDEKYGDDNGFRNDVKSCKALAGSMPTAPMKSATATATAEAPAAKPPWAR